MLVIDYREETYSNTNINHINRRPTGVLAYELIICNLLQPAKLNPLSKKQPGTTGLLSTFPETTVASTRKQPFDFEQCNPKVVPQLGAIKWSLVMTVVHQGGIYQLKTHQGPRLRLVKACGHGAWFVLVTM